MPRRQPPPMLGAPSRHPVIRRCSVCRQVGHRIERCPQRVIYRVLTEHAGEVEGDVDEPAPLNFDEETPRRAEGFYELRRDVIADRVEATRQWARARAARQRQN